MTIHRVLVTRTVTVKHEAFVEVNAQHGALVQLAALGKVNEVPEENWHFVEKNTSHRCGPLNKEPSIEFHNGEQE